MYSATRSIVMKKYRILKILGLLFFIIWSWLLNEFRLMDIS